MVFILIILHFVCDRMKKRIDLADQGKKVEVMPSYRKTFDLCEFLFIVRRNYCYSNDCKCDGKYTNKRCRIL